MSDPKDFNLWDDPPSPLGTPSPSEQRNRGFCIPAYAYGSTRDDGVREPEWSIYRIIEVYGDEFLAIGHHWFGTPKADTLRLEDIPPEEKERMLREVQARLDKMTVEEKEGIAQKMLDDMERLWELHIEDTDLRYTDEDVKRWEGLEP